MADPTMQQVLDRLDALQATVDTRARRLAQHECRQGRKRLTRRFLPLALVALLVALTPLSLLAAGPFNDLTGGVHDANIQAIYDAGITKGCVPNVSYCPTANVTREEMASFLARTAGLGTNPPVANANKVQGYAPNELLRVYGSAQGPNVLTDIGGVYNPDNPNNSTFSTIGSASIIAPGPGFVVVSACPGSLSIRMVSDG